MKRVSLLGIAGFLILASGAIVMVDAGKGSLPEIRPDTGRMRDCVKFLTELRPYRNFLNVKSLDSVAGWIAERFSSAGLTVEIQEFTVEGKVYRNVIGSLRKELPTRVVVGAHYDVCGDQEGADDNASAVAGLIETARLVSEMDSLLHHRVDFAAYSLEEPPFFGTHHMGSYVHAQSLLIQNAKVKGMICLEMIGYFTEEENSQDYPIFLLKPFYPSKGNFIAVVGNFGSGSLVRRAKKYLKRTSLPVRTLKAPSWVTGVDFSDHRNFWHFGYDAIMITDTAFYRNKNYHLATDTMEKLDFAKMAEVVKGVCWVLVGR